MKLVSSRFIAHTGPMDADLCFIGDNPNGSDDLAEQILSGSAGSLFDNALSSFGLTRDEVRIANVLNYQPAKNNFQLANMTPQMAESKAYLKGYLANASHKVLIPMGNAALEFITGLDKLEKRRGSVYQYGNAFVVPTVHPSSILQDGGLAPAFMHDVARAIEISKNGWKFPEFNFILDPDIFKLEALLPTILSASRLYVDIETKKYTRYVRCIGVAWSPTDSVCIFNDCGYGGVSLIGHNFRSVVSRILESPIPKTFHNGMYDTIILEENGLTTINFDYDTMAAQHALQPELPKGLDYCTSMYTRINYYKDDGKESGDGYDRTKLARYNCMDTVATAQVQAAQEQEMDEVARKMFQFNMDMIPTAKHFSYTGQLVDEERRDEIRNRVDKKMLTDYAVFFHLLSNVYGVEIFKVSQHERIKDFLYKTLGFTPKTNKEGKITADEDAIVSLMGTAQKSIQDLKTEKGKLPWQHKMACLKLILRIRGYEKLLSSYVNIKLSPDGRARSWMKHLGTETIRWSAGSWYDKTGLNNQTIPREAV